MAVVQEQIVHSPREFLVCLSYRFVQQSLVHVQKNEFERLVEGKVVDADCVGSREVVGDSLRTSYLTQ